SGEKIFTELNKMGFTGLKLAQGDSIWMGGIKKLDEDGKLHIQLSMAAYEKDFYRLYSNMNTILNKDKYETDHLRVDAVKLFADGVPFGKTMYIKDTYPNSDHHGVPFEKPEVLIEKIVKYNGMGLPVMVHSTGDAGADVVITATEKAMEKYGAEKVRALRNHIAHNVIVDPNDYERMITTNVIMEFSPSFWFPRPIIDQAEADLGYEMLQKVWPFGTTARSGANVAIGADWNQAQCDPFINTETLVTRRAPGATEDDPILGPENAASLETVLEAYTMGGAYSMYMEDEIGSIEVGKRANFIVLNKNLFEIPENEIHKAFVKETYFEGEQVYKGVTKVSF
ncbi:MAG: amidohydrolase family protein, partial [Bacteroidales bacterium]|nr:amidohydrolase family protein [Bacteroidales bacterium]